MTMTEGEKRFASIKDKARKLIHDDAKQDAHIIKERVADRNNAQFFRDQPNDAYSSMQNMVSSRSLNETTMNDDDSEERLYSAIDSKMNALMEKNNVTGYNNVTPEVKNKNLPKEILESFGNNYIDQSVFDPNMSVLTKMGIQGDSLAEEVQKKQPIVEQQSKIDYGLIKDIVENAVKKYITALGKKMLTENKAVNENNEINAIQFTGKKFVFVTKGGDLFESNLKFIKNVNNK